MAEMSEYEREIRDEIKALGGKPGGKSSIETLEVQLAGLKEVKIYARSFTVSANQQEVTSELIEVEHDNLQIIIPKRLSHARAKKSLWWFAQSLYRYWKHGE